MGDSDLISKAYAKNGTLMQKIVVFDRKLPRKLGKRFSPKQLTWLMLGYSLFCVVLVIAISKLMPDVGQTATNIVFAIWIVPISLMAAIPQLCQAESSWGRDALYVHRFAVRLPTSNQAKVNDRH